MPVTAMCRVKEMELTAGVDSAAEMPESIASAIVGIIQHRTFRSISCDTTDVHSPLPLHHVVDPDRSEGGRAALRHGIVAKDAQLLADRDRPLAELGVVDADFRQAHVHRPLHFGNSGAHLLLDAIE